MVTVCSCMACSRADCVLAGARLISCASTSLSRSVLVIMGCQSSTDKAVEENPNPKLQIPNKLQEPKSQHAIACGGLDFGVWSFLGFWILDFGFCLHFFLFKMRVISR